ncbi:hypothetical protein ACXR6G_13900 [Ancylomarina sp. YFZ004]
MRNYFIKGILFIFSFMVSFSLFARTINVGVEEVYENGLTSSVEIIVKGKLVVYGDLIMTNQKDLIIAEGGIVIVTGNLSIGKNISVSTSGYLIANSFSAPGKWGGKFKVGDKDKVYINSIYVQSGDLKHLPVLETGNHFTIPALEGNNPDIWDYFQKVSTGATGGTIEIVGNPNSCSEASLPSIVNKTEAWPAAYDSYSWEYSSTTIDWTSTGSLNIDLVFIPDFPEPGLPVGAYSFRRKVIKSNGAGDPKYSGEVTVTVNPLPAPIGIFF